MATRSSTGTAARQRAGTSRPTGRGGAPTARPGGAPRTARPSAARPSAARPVARTRYRNGRVVRRRAPIGRSAALVAALVAGVALLVGPGAGWLPGHPAARTAETTRPRTPGPRLRRTGRPWR